MGGTKPRLVADRRNNGDPRRNGVTDITAGINLIPGARSPQPWGTPKPGLSTEAKLWYSGAAVALFIWLTPLFALVKIAGLFALFCVLAVNVWHIQGVRNSLWFRLPSLALVAGIVFLYGRFFVLAPVRTSTISGTALGIIGAHSQATKLHNVRSPQPRPTPSLVAQITKSPALLRTPTPHVSLPLTNSAPRPLPKPKPTPRKVHTIKIVEPIPKNVAWPSPETIVGQTVAPTAAPLASATWIPKDANAAVVASGGCEARTDMGYREVTTLSQKAPANQAMGALQIMLRMQTSETGNYHIDSLSDVIHKESDRFGPDNPADWIGAVEGLKKTGFLLKVIGISGELGLWIYAKDSIWERCYTNYSFDVKTS